MFGSDTDFLTKSVKHHKTTTTNSLAQSVKPSANATDSLILYFNKQNVLISKIGFDRYWYARHWHPVTATSLYTDDNENPLSRT